MDATNVILKERYVVNAKMNLIFYQMVNVNRLDACKINLKVLTVAKIVHLYSKNVDSAK